MCHDNLVYRFHFTINTVGALWGFMAMLINFYGDGDSQYKNSIMQVIDDIFDISSIR